MPSHKRRTVPDVNSDTGMTVVEVLVAGLLLVVGGLGVLGIVDAATRNTFRAEQSQIVANVLQQEMEEVRRLPYAEVALTSLPVHSVDETDPNWRVSGTAFYTNRNGAGLKPLAYNGGLNGGETVSGGTVDPGPTPFTVDDVTGLIYRYVVWDPCPAALCQDADYLKRVIVAVKLDETGAGGVRRYQETQAQFVDPEVKPKDNPGPGAGGSGAVPVAFFLSDTPCSSEVRQPIVGSHHTHNTRGGCSAGPRTGNEPGAPDLLLRHTAPLSDESPLHDYATDVEPGVDPDHDKGLQLLKGAQCGNVSAAAGVATAPDADATLFQKIHRWLSAPLHAASGSLALTGTANIGLWTRSIEGGVYPATICVWLFVRNAAGTVDTLAVNRSSPLVGATYFTHTLNPWPSGGWTEIDFDLKFGASGSGGDIPLLSGSRIGLAISVDSSSGSGVQFLYDEPSFDSRLEVKMSGTLAE